MLLQGGASPLDGLRVIGAMHGVLKACQPQAGTSCNSNECNSLMGCNPLDEDKAGDFYPTKNTSPFRPKKEQLADIRFPADDTRRCV